jgi:CRP-like cAMP-binding protein
MAHVVVTARPDDLVEVAELLVAHGHAVTLVPGAPEWEALPPPERLLGDGVASLPLRRADATLLVGSLGHAPLSFHGNPPEHAPGQDSGRPVRYRSGERAAVQPGWPMEIVDGAVALTAVHADGAEVMIGMLGPGDFLVHHPSDQCRIEAVAQTDVRAESYMEEELLSQRRYAAALASRVLRSEAWAASQAHPYIEQRLLGILNLLSEQFGIAQEGGRLIDLRLTHGQLAAITGATRPTITRVIAALTRTGHIGVIGAGANRRLCVFSGGV